jgi:hypothetical protein
LALDGYVSTANNETNQSQRERNNMKTSATLLLCALSVSLVYGQTSTNPPAKNAESKGVQDVSTFEISVNSTNWAGKEHPLDTLKRGIERGLQNLKLSRVVDGKPADLKVGLSFGLERLWDVSEDGQYLVMMLPGTLEVSLPNSRQPPMINLYVLTGSQLRFSSTRSSLTQRIRFENYQIAMNTCTNLEGGFPEDGLWEHSSEALANQVNQIVEADIKWIRSGSIEGFEALLSSGIAPEETVVALLGQVKSEAATKLLQKIAVEGKTEKGRNATKKMLEKTEQSKFPPSNKVLQPTATAPSVSTEP